MSARLTHTLSAADLGTETGFDGGDRPTRTTGVTDEEEQTVFSLVKLAVRAAAGLASDILDNILNFWLADILGSIVNDRSMNLPSSRRSQYPFVGIVLVRY